MVTYGDYFSKKVLHSCGVSPNKILLEKEEIPYTGTQRIQKIQSEMSSIYQTLYSGHVQKNGKAQSEELKNFALERKIVAAFFDSGVLSSAERDYFQTQSMDEREKISVEEANPLAEASKSQKVDSQIKTPQLRNVRQ